MFTFTVQTKGNTHLVNLTEKVSSAVRDLGIKDGAILVFAKHTTCGLFINEDEEGLKKDIKNFFERLIPEEGDYAHFCEDSGRNGYSHLRALLMGQSVVVPVEKGELVLGIWQQIFLVDFDNKSRSREIVVTEIGGRD